MYVDYRYYVDTYLMSRDPLIPENEFSFWERQAERELDHITFDRIQKNASLVDENVMDCMCELTEYLYKQDRYIQSVSEDGMMGTLSSYSNDGESATYDVSSLKEKYSDSAKPSVIHAIISKYLSRTGLMYRGL